MARRPHRPRKRPRAVSVLAGLLLGPLVLVACSPGGETPGSSGGPASAGASPNGGGTPGTGSGGASGTGPGNGSGSASGGASATTGRGATPPPWLGTRVLPEAATGFGEVRRTPPALRTRRFTLPDTLPPLPGRGYAARIADPAPDRVLDRSTWRPGCPVARDDLAWLRVAFRGFDGERHTGELLVHADAAADLRRVFRDLWRARFPLEQMTITPAAALDVPPTGDGNNTGAFVCRPVTGGSSFSQHAYGLAVDVNPFQNPYRRGAGEDRVVLPELASAYLDRSRRAPGMVRRGGPVVRAFARIGWTWGGDYRSLKDWQHFSATGG